MNDVLGDMDTGATVTYTPATTGNNANPAILTLSGANIATGLHVNTSTKGIYYTGSDELHIVLASNTENIIRNVHTGIYPVNADLTISGTGKLTTTGLFHGIYSVGSIKIENGEVIASATTSGYTAMEAGSIEINNCTLHLFLC